MSASIASVLAATLSVGPFGGLVESLTNVRAAAVYDGALICLQASGGVAAWDLKSEKYAKDAADRYARDRLTSLATSRDRLWATDDKTVYLWSAKGTKWEKIGTFDSGGEALFAIVPVGETPFLVFPSKIIDPVREKDGVFKIPEDADLPRKPPLRLLAAHGTESMVWIGTGNGEWGGTLIGLDPGAGKWVTAHGFRYVTGITHSTKDEITVSWSMSHFTADTQIAVHKTDATAKTRHPALREQYYQCLAYNPHDEQLYGVEQGDVVTIKDGKPTKVAALTGRLYVREPMAIGVAPGVARLIPIGPKTLVAVPKRGQPWLIREKEAVRLRLP